MHNCRGIHKKKKGPKKKNDYYDETLSSDPAEGGEPENLPESVASLRSRSPEWVFTIAGMRTSRLSLLSFPNAPSTPTPAGPDTPSSRCQSTGYQSSPVAGRILTRDSASASNPRREQHFGADSFTTSATARWFASPPGLALTGEATTPGGRLPSGDFVTPALASPLAGYLVGVRLDRRTGNLRSSGLSPDKVHQLALLHLQRVVRPRGARFSVLCGATREMSGSSPGVRERGVARARRE